MIDLKFLSRGTGAVVLALCSTTMGYPQCTSAPLACSAKPSEFSELSEPSLMIFNSVFYEACVAHDYCYRHGYATYGKSRSSCDDDFYHDMLDLCGNYAISGVLNTVGVSVACSYAAALYYQGVHHLGQSAYKAAGSTCCWYRKTWTITVTRGPGYELIEKRLRTVPGQCPETVPITAPVRVRVKDGAELLVW